MPATGQSGGLSLMNDVNFSTFYNAVRILSEQLKEVGLSWEYITDQTMFSKMCEDLTNRNPTEPFDFPYFDFTEMNAFFIVVKNDASEIVSLQAARMENIGRKKLADYWGNIDREGQQIRLYAQHDKEAVLGNMHSPGAFQIDRCVVFHGNLHTNREWRRRGVSGIFSRLGLLTILNRWRPDYVYGLMDPFLASEGWAVHSGYQQAEPSGVHWKVPPKHIGKDDYLVFNTFDQLLHLMEVTANDRVGFELLKPA